MKNLLVVIPLALTLCTISLARPSDPEQAGSSAPASSSKEVQTASDGLVTVSSKGGDVRSVLFDLYQQGKRSFVLEPNLRFALYLHLESVDFDEALALILQMADLKAEKQNGITFITRKPDPKPVIQTPVQTPPVAQPKPEPKPAAKPMGRLTQADLQKKITTRFSKAEIKTVFAEFSLQTGLIIEVADSVPLYKVDAFLLDTSLKFGLDALCNPAGLKWKLTDNMSVLIEKKQP